MKTERNPRGAGRKPAPPELKKKPFGTRLPIWLLDYIAAQPEPASVVIEKALCQQYGWTPPPIKGQSK
jgi:hypothetical protein